MKLVSYRTAEAFSNEPGRIANLGVVIRDRVVPASALVADYPTIFEFLADSPRSRTMLEASFDSAGREIADSTLTLADVELVAPVPRPGKIVAVGVNYREHASEQSREPPDHPVLFAKLPTSVTGPGSDVRWDPRLTQAVDLEGELAVVIGRRCRRVAESEALEHVGGYTCLNDVTARDLQYADKQFVRGKSLDTFCPMGPWLVTADEIADPQQLRLRSFVNGEPMQDASTADMIFGVAALVSFCSQAFTLEPCDVIATGTPSGVGWFREPKQLLRDGDEMVVEIDGIGRLANTCREETETQ
jgi:2-keto-4-pentenoate hydratase/2-oxohepta-3-ene-1,7-dioic acid hydratase in catechol pathway